MCLNVKPQPCTLDPKTLETPKPKFPGPQLDILNPKPPNPIPKPQTLNPKSQTPNPEPQTLNPSRNPQGHQDVIKMGIAKYNEECRGIAPPSGQTPKVGGCQNHGSFKGSPIIIRHLLFRVPKKGH